MIDVWQKCPNCKGGCKEDYYYTCRVCIGHGIINKLTGKPPVGKVYFNNRLGFDEDMENIRKDWPI